MVIQLSLGGLIKMVQNLMRFGEFRKVGDDLVVRVRGLEDVLFNRREFVRGSRHWKG